MRITKPNFYNDFKCKTSECTDTCCVGWEIDIDTGTFEKYKVLEGKFGDYLRENIIKSDDSFCFKLKEGDRCPFLDEKKLCTIITEYGFDMTCDICREHPRFYEWYGDYKDAGIGLCCEEGCRLLFENNSKLKFIKEDCEDDKENNNYIDDDEKYFAEFFYNAREIAFNILQNREKSLSERIINLFEYSVKVQNENFTDDYEAKKDDLCNENDFYKEIVNIMENSEPINEEWTFKIKELNINLSELTENKEEFEKQNKDHFYEYEHFLVYTVFRYFIKALWNGNIVSIIKFCVINLIFVYLLDIKIWLENLHTFTLEDRINNVKLWSKQIEYSEENVEFIIEQCYKNSILNVTHIVNFLKSEKMF